MNILLSNDDGYSAPGIRCLHRHLRQIKTLKNLTVVAPSHNRSAASNSLTLELPIRAVVKEDGFISVSGTPTDSVHLALTGLLTQDPDIVIAGINAGANLGDDVLYSGTVAAAMEGRFLGYPAIAVSLVLENGKPAEYDTAGLVVLDLLARLPAFNLPSNTILNVNIPNVPYADLNGWQATRLGHRHKSKPVVKQQDPRGEDIYWIGEQGKAKDAGEGTDFYAISQDIVSITPLQIDLTRHQVLNDLSAWLQD